MNRDPHESLSTADLAGVAEEHHARQHAKEAKHEANEAHAKAHANVSDEKLAPLFTPDTANEFRARWDQVQFSFVDDPKRAVREGDELVAQVMKCLAQSFSQERTKLEHELGHTDAGSTENLRMALRRYRSFFQRLLSL